MPEVFVGIGSNIDPHANLDWAIRALTADFGELSCSHVFESPAFGFEGPDFLNMVVSFATDRDVDAVESILSDLENQRGRETGGRSGSRTLDLDLLMYGERVDAGRRLPRSDILAYPFVLAPLAQIAPALIHPVTGLAAASAWERMAGPRIELDDVGPIGSA